MTLTEIDQKVDKNHFLFEIHQGIFAYWKY